MEMNKYILNDFMDFFRQFYMYLETIVLHNIVVVNIKWDSFSAVFAWKMY